MSDGKHHCLAIVDAFSRFIQVYPIESTDATHTFEATSAITTSLGILRRFVWDRGTSFMIADFSMFLREFSRTHAPRTKWSRWTKGKVQKQNKQLSRFFPCSLSEAGNNWAKLACQFAFAHNTLVISSTGTTPYEVVFVFKPRIPFSSILSLFRDDNHLHQSEFCQPLPTDTHMDKETSQSCIRNLLTSKSLTDFTYLRNSIQECISQRIAENLRSQLSFLSCRNKYQLAEPLLFGQKVLLGNLNIPFRKSQQMCDLRNGLYLVTKVIKKIISEIFLDADAMRTQVVHRNLLVQYFARDSELPSLLFINENLPAMTKPNISITNVQKSESSD